MLDYLRLCGIGRDRQEQTNKKTKKNQKNKTRNRPRYIQNLPVMGMEI